MEIKTMDGWHEFAKSNSNGGWDKYCKPGDGTRRSLWIKS